jgi:Arc/MetJ family transcription regulator
MSPTALERLALYFGAVRTRQGILARAALGTPGTGDAALAQELAGALSAELRPDGTIMGGAVPTIWRVHELLDLGRDAAHPTLVALLAWLMGSQGQPGAYGEGCDKGRHAQRICEHWARSFFSPAPAEVRVAPITLPNGKAFRVEAAARFAISCLGLRAALRAGLGDQPGPAQHLESLCLLSEQWTSWSGSFVPDVIVAGLHALALGGATARANVEQLVGMIAAHQAPDGVWPNADLFATLEALHATGLETARTAVGRALPALTERQRADGTFGAMAQQERALIALRALRWADPEV